MKIMLFDTSVCSTNLGDFIIMDSVRKHIIDLFPESILLNTATHEYISRPSYKVAKASNFSFVGGSNLLSSNMLSYNQWKVSLKDGFFLDNIVLMGVGWWKYQRKPNIYTKLLLKSILSHKLVHSVRDSYTEAMLRSAGFDNVINTACPTMWRLDEGHCEGIPTEKGDVVVTTLTDYKKDFQSDFDLLELLRNTYRKVYIWPQSSGDIGYLAKIDASRFGEILNPRLEVFDRLLQVEESIDYVGTRLHAGIRALQFQRRAIILAIDNRAQEKSRDFNIVISPRNDIGHLRSLIYSNFNTHIRLPESNIHIWKSQFK